MEKLKIAFSGFNGKIKPNDNFIIDILKKRYEVVLSEQPDFLFYSVNSSDYLNYKCVRIFYTSENIVPDFNICDYGIGFHYIGFEDRYFRYPIFLVDGFNAYEGDDYGLDLQLALHKHEKASMKLEEKSEFCSFVYSNRKAVSCREDFFDILSKYKKVNSGGQSRNNIGGPVKSKRDFQSKHKFVIAFENTSTPGYTTEKLISAFAAGAIPIYWGDPEVTQVFNPNAFINCHDYGVSSFGDNTEAFNLIVDRIIKLDNDESEYLEMLSSPAFISDSYVEDVQNGFEKFLFHIVEQEPIEAYRRNRYVWGERYERKQKIGNTVYWQLRRFIPLRDCLKKLIRLE